MNTAPQDWILRLCAARGPERLRLLCFPYAGGASHIYASWPAALPDGVTLLAAQLPGRARRFQEVPLTSIEHMALGVAQALAAHEDAPLVFFGHSMGALLAFECARLLRRMGRPEPRRLLLSAYRAPHLPRRAPDIHPLPDEAFVQRLRELEGTPAEVFEHPELLALMLPVVRADFTAVETYSLRPQPPLECPITVFRGTHDPHFDDDAIGGWSTHTRGEFAMHTLPGSHFFIHSASDELLRLVSAELARQLQAPQPALLHATAP